MDPILLSLLVGSVGGPIGGLAAGAVGATVLRRVSAHARGSVLAFAGGFILCAAFLELLGPAVEGAGGWSAAVVVAALAAGAALHGAVRWLVAAHDESGERHGARRKAQRIAVSLAVVNLIEGLPVGAAFAVDTRVGLLIGALMIFENFTEGLTISSELSGERQRSTRRLLFLTTAPTVTLGLGAALAAWLGGLSPLLLSAFLGAGAGIMIHVVTGEIMGDIRELHGGKVPMVWLFVGVAVGTLFAALE